MVRSMPARSRAGCSEATTAARAGASSPDCSSSRPGPAGAFRRDPGRRTCAGSPRARIASCTEASSPRYRPSPGRAHSRNRSRGVLRLTRAHTLTVDEQRLGEVTRFRAIVAEDGLRGVLREVDPPHAVGRVGTAPVKERAREAGDAPGGHDHGVARVVPEVADQVVRLVVTDVLDDVARAGARVGEEVHRAVRFGDVVEGDPAREVGRVRVLDEAGVLMPAELHPALGGLDDVLLVEQVDGVAERCLRDLAHQAGGQEPFDRPALAVRMDEVAAAPVVAIERDDAESIHLTVAFVDETLALTSQRVEIVGREDILEDEEALVAVLPHVLFGQGHGGKHHIRTRSRPRSGLVLAWFHARRDREPVPAVDRDDRPDQLCELVLRESRSRLVPDAARHMVVADQGDRVGQRQGGAFALVEEGRLVPSSDRVEALLALTAFAGVLRVHVDAVGAAVDDRGAKADEVAERCVQLDRVVEGRHRSIGHTRRSCDAHAGRLEGGDRFDHDSPFSSQSVEKLGLRWMSIWLSRPSPELTNPCGWPCGMSTISPACTSRFPLPSSSVACPSRMMRSSWYGCVCSAGPRPGSASTKMTQIPTPPYSAPTNSRAITLHGSSSCLTTLTLTRSPPQCRAGGGCWRR